MIFKSSIIQANLSEILIYIKAFVESKSMLKYWGRGNGFTNNIQLSPIHFDKKTLWFILILPCRWSTTPWTGLNNLTEWKNFGSKTWNEPKHGSVLHHLKAVSILRCQSQNLRENWRAKIHLSWNKGENATGTKQVS